MTKHKIPALAVLLLLLLYTPSARSFLAGGATEPRPRDLAADAARAAPAGAVKNVSAGGGDAHAAGAAAAPAGSARRVAATQAPIKFNFRQTAAFVADGPGEVYVLSSDGPGTTRGGVTFGWANTDYVGSRNRDSGADRRFAGTNVPGGELGGITFQVELPSAGAWRVRVALGDYWYDVRAAAQIYDGATKVLTIPSSMTGGRGRYKDAAGDVHRSPEDWLSNNKAKEIEFTTTVFKIKVGTPVGENGSDKEHPIAHLVIEPAGPFANAGPDKTVAAGRAATLDGGNSIGASFLWEQVSGTAVAINNPTAPQAGYTAPTPSADSEVLTFRLTVDGVPQDAVRHFVVKADAGDVVQLGDPKIALLVGRQLIHGSDKNPFPQFDDIQSRRALYWAARVPDIPPMTLTGTVSVNNGSTQVVGAGTRFTQEVNLATGEARFHRRLCIRDCSSEDGGVRRDVTVLSVQDDTHLTLAAPWAHASAADAHADTDYYWAADTGWNRDAILSAVYYDLPFTLYQAYYRSGNPDILAEARRVALAVWRHPHFREGSTTIGGQTPPPREAKLQGLWLRHLESGGTAFPKLWDWSDMYVRYHLDEWVMNRINDPEFYLDTREAGYALMFAAYLSRILPDSYPDRPSGTEGGGAAKRDEYLRQVGEAATGYFGRLQRQEDGAYVHDSPYWKLPEGSNCTVIDNQSVLFSGILAEGLTAVHEVTESPTVKASVVSQLRKYADNLLADFWREEKALDYGDGNVRWRSLWEFGYGGTTGGPECDPDYFSTPAHRGNVNTGGDADKIRRERQNNGENHHVFGFVYRTTGDGLYKTKGDLMFGASFGDDLDILLNQVNLGKGDAVQQKVYSQNMRSSGRYLVDRLTGVAAPSSLTVTAVTSSTVSLSWADAATNETGFKVERCRGSGCADFAQVAALGVNATTFNDLALDAGTSYAYRVRAYNAGGNSAYSNTASATTAPNSLPPPTGLSAKATSTTAVHLSWAAPGGAPVLRYEVYRHGGGGYALAGEPTSPAYDDNGRTPGAAYLYRVRAVYADSQSTYSNVELATTVVFTDNPLQAGVNTVKAAHLGELREAVGAARALAGLGPAAWTHPAPVSAPPGERRLIYLEDVTELRGRLGEALTALGIHAPYEADPPLTRYALVRKEHFMQIRARVE